MNQLVLFTQEKNRFWLRQGGAQFFTKGITRERTIYDYILGNRDNDEAELISDCF